MDDKSPTPVKIITPCGPRRESASVTPPPREINQSTTGYRLAQLCWGPSSFIVKMASPIDNFKLTDCKEK